MLTNLFYLTLCILFIIYSPIAVYYILVISGYYFNNFLDYLFSKLRR